MLTIRSEQMKALAATRMRQFEKRLGLHAQATFPDKCGALGTEAAEALIARSVERAHMLGLRGEKETRQYVDLSLALGEGFESDPKNEWAHALISQSGPASKRMEATYSGAISNLDAETAAVLLGTESTAGRSEIPLRYSDTVLPCQKKTWIEIQLLGVTGKPIPYERYRIELPNGDVEDGHLDEDGVAGVELIDPGTCHVIFPELDRSAVHRDGSTAGTN